MSKRLFLEVDTSQIDIKKILKKDFLELSMRAISSANPNRNNSWFTKESMEKSIGSFVNKPILGYFENGDFVSHNGDWTYDPETNMDYWDTLGSKGERILGTIRESDEVKIVEDENGLSWVVFSCILWTQYCYKQVKRLLKDAKRAQKNGGSTKNISVEVDITDYEILDNGVMKINEFKLVGVTILGSRNSVKVEPGIEDAELSVVDVMGHDVYNKQTQALRLAYEKLDNDAINEEDVILEDKQPIINDPVIDEAKAPIAEDHVENVEHVTEEHFENKDPEVQEPVQEEQKEIKENEVVEEPKNEVFEGVNDTSNENDKKENVVKDTQDDKTVDFDEHAVDVDNQEPQVDPIHDLSFLIADCTWNIDSLNSTIEYYKQSNNEHKEYVIAVLQRIINRQKESEKELGVLLGKISSGEISDEDIRREEQYSKYSNLDDLIEKYEQCISEKDELSQKYEVLEQENQKNKDSIAAYEHKEYVAAANELIDSANIEDEKIVKQFKVDCENNVITSLEDLKVKVAVYAFDNHTEVTPKAFSAPVDKPNVDAAFSKKTKKAQIGHWDALHAYVHDGE